MRTHTLPTVLLLAALATGCQDHAPADEEPLVLDVSETDADAEPEDAPRVDTPLPDTAVAPDLVDDEVTDTGSADTADTTEPVDTTDATDTDGPCSCPSDAGCCLADGCGCVVDTECCGGQCDQDLGVCHTCRPLDAACTESAQCCSQRCEAGLCVENRTGTCAADAERCRLDADCCQGFCGDDRLCTTCVATGDACQPGRPCCNPQEGCSAAGVCETCLSCDTCLSCGNAGASCVCQNDCCQGLICIQGQCIIP